MSFAEAERRVRVKHEKGRGWHIDVWVKWPGRRRARRERITWAPSIGRLESKHDAERVANRIRALAEQKPLHEVLRDYVLRDLPENHVLERWRVAYLPHVERRYRSGEISSDYYRALCHYPDRVPMQFWRGVSVHHVDESALERWLEWMRQEHPDLGPIALRQYLRYVGLFLRFERRLGMTDRVPELPRVPVPRKRRRVPREAALKRILDAIPEEIRGLWLARALAGLRPRESREVRVAHYRKGVIYLPEGVTKTKEARALPILWPELDEWIRRYRADAAPGEPLFVNPKAYNPLRQWRPSVEADVWRRACERAGVEHIPPNIGGRHAFATHEAKRGTEPEALRRYLGHSDFKTTQRYLDDWDEVELAERMRPGEAFAAQPPPRGESSTRNPKGNR